jgi:hypothetical protein
MMGISDQELLERAERALQLAEQLPDLVRAGNPSKEIVEELARLLHSLPIDSPSRPQLDWPDPLKAILAKVLDCIQSSQTSALDWMQSTITQVDRITRRRGMQRAYESHRGSH